MCFSMPGRLSLLVMFVFMTFPLASVNALNQFHHFHLALQRINKKSKSKGGSSHGRIFPPWNGNLTLHVLIVHSQRGHHCVMLCSLSKLLRSLWNFTSKNLKNTKFTIYLTFVHKWIRTLSTLELKLLQRQPSSNYLHSG